MKLWTEAVNFRWLLESLIIKSGRKSPVLETWSEKSVRSLLNKLAKFGRIGYFVKKDIVKGMMATRGFTEIIIDCVANSAPGTYRFYNSNSKRFFLKGCQMALI